MACHTFGGDWTINKLERLKEYLKAYAQIFAKNEQAKKLNTFYIDAFAGTGYRATEKDKPQELDLFAGENDCEREEFLKGSASIALEVEPPLKNYIFVDSKKQHINQLEELKKKYPKRTSQIQIVQDDANEFLNRWCPQMDAMDRAVVFLDPYGMQVDWNLIETIAKTKKIDLWLLFPLGVAVSRLLTKEQSPPEKWAQALTRIFGTEDWKNAFYKKEREQSLFGEEENQVREADFQAIGQFMVDRLKSVFTMVADNPLALINSRNVPLYLLCFATGNPKGAPTAIKIAKYILEKGR